MAKEDAPINTSCGVHINIKYIFNPDHIIPENRNISRKEKNYYLLESLAKFLNQDLDSIEFIYLTMPPTKFENQLNHFHTVVFVSSS